MKSVVISSKARTASNFSVGDYLVQPHEDEPIYARVVEPLKGGGYRVIVVGGWQGTHAVTKSTKGWYPNPKQIRESDVPLKFVRAIKKRFNMMFPHGVNANDRMERISSRIAKDIRADSGDVESYFNVADYFRSSMDSPVYSMRRVLTPDQTKGAMSLLEDVVRGLHEKFHKDVLRETRSPKWKKKMEALGIQPS